MQVPVTSHQKHKSDLLNNPDSRNMLWFPEKSRASKLKGKFLASQKKAADNKQQGLAAERLQGPTDSSGKSQVAVNLIKADGSMCTVRFNLLSG